PATDIYPLSLHDALPISGLEEGNITEFTSRYVGCELEVTGETGEVFVYPDWRCHGQVFDVRSALAWSSNVFFFITSGGEFGVTRSEEHTSELQSRENLVC